MDKTKGWLALAEEDLLWAKASFEDKIYTGALWLGNKDLRT